jgi:hypothetical protein
VHFDSLLAVVVSHVSWVVSFVVFRYVSVVPNLVLRADTFPIAMLSWLS